MPISEKIIGEMTARRRDFHTYPECGWTEFRTTAIIASELERLGWTICFCGDFLDPDYVMGYHVNVESEKERAAEQGADKAVLARMGRYTGLTAELDSGNAGPVTALRFDIDCVETSEAQDAGHFPSAQGFASRRPGLMHACGHDGHAAVGLALAGLLSESADRLRGKVRLIFQPAEEGVRGGYAMSSSGAAEGVDYFIATHFGLGVPTGTVCGGTEGFLCSTKFDVDFKGVAAHAGGEPERGRNALLAAASAALGLHSIAPHSGGATRINVGVLNAGEGRNVVPPNAYMKIEVRGESADLASYVYSRAEEIIRGAAQMYGVEASVSKEGETIAAFSDDDLSHIILEEAKTVEGVAKIEPLCRMKGSDDACWYMKKTQERGGKAAYVVIGADLAAGHHNGRFDFDERAMPIALEVLYNSVIRLCGVHGL